MAVLYNVAANDMNLYAWDFLIRWESAILELVDHELLVPPGWVEGVDYVVLFDEVIEDTWNKLHIGVTKIGNSTGFVDDRIELVWMEFHILVEPAWHSGCIETDLEFWDVDLVMWTAECGAPMDCITEDAPVDINPARPNMEITFSPDSPVEEKEAQGWINNTVVTAYLWVSNVTKLFDIGCGIWWNPDLLRIDIQQIYINEETFPPPWSFLILEVYPGYIEFCIERPCEKPPLKGTFWVLQMDFKVKCYEDMDGVPIPGDTVIGFEWAGLSFKDGEFMYYYMPGDDPAGSGLDGFDTCYCLKISTAHYWWTPIPGDFNQDGHVGVDDILIMAEHYGMDGSWDMTGPAGTSDGYVDIYDIIWVAKRYCNNTPPPIPEP
jgi:hypothetical protein